MIIEWQYRWNRLYRRPPAISCFGSAAGTFLPVRALRGSYFQLARQPERPGFKVDQK
jgi:hypothetical protein